MRKVKEGETTNDLFALGCVIADTFDKAASVNVLALEGIKGNVTAIFDAHGFAVGRVK